MQISQHADDSVSINLDKIETAQLYQALQVAVDSLDADREFVLRLIKAIER